MEAVDYSGSDKRGDGTPKKNATWSSQFQKESQNMKIQI